MASIIFYEPYVNFLNLGLYVTDLLENCTIFIPPVYKVYRGFIVFAFSICVCVCKLFFSSKISQELLDLGS